MIFQNNYFTAEQNISKIGKIVYCTARKCFLVKKGFTELVFKLH